MLHSIFINAYNHPRWVLYLEFTREALGLYKNLRYACGQISPYVSAEAFGVQAKDPYIKVLDYGCIPTSLYENIREDGHTFIEKENHLPRMEFVEVTDAHAMIVVTENGYLGWEPFRRSEDEPTYNTYGMKLELHDDYFVISDGVANCWNRQYGAFMWRKPDPQDEAKDDE